MSVCVNILAYKISFLASKRVWISLNSVPGSW